jgi:lysophospholipase L1-like esterase
VSLWIVVVLALLGAACASTVGPDVEDDEQDFDPATSTTVDEGATAGRETAGPSEDVDTMPGESPSPAPSPTAEPTPTATPSRTAEPTPGTEPSPTAEPTPTAESTPTAEPVETVTPPENIAPIAIAPRVVATVGGVATSTISARDSDGRVVSTWWSGLPQEATATGGVLTWRPTRAGTWTATVNVVDDRGATVSRPATLLARYPAHRHALIGMGDSVPSGHGLQETDYLGRDKCWRDGGEAYPRQVLDALVEIGLVDGNAAELGLVACSGHDPDDLFETPVTGGLAGTAPDGQDELTQLEWAVRANARIVTVTIGANDTGFVGPEKLLLPDNTLDREDVARRMRIVEADLTTILDRLVGATDSIVFVTTYYNPTAPNPQGVEGCREECFGEKAEEVVRALNDVITDVGSDYGDRVVVVDLFDLFAGHGAPNGVGPDGLREGGFGFLGELIGGLVSDVHPYCARGDTIGDSWINSIDCVHPDARGTTEIAQAVTAAILDRLG